MAAGMLAAIENGSLGYARDDGVGKRMSQRACKGLVLVMRLRRISIRRFARPFSKGLLM